MLVIFRTYVSSHLFCPLELKNTLRAPTRDWEWVGGEGRGRREVSLPPHPPDLKPQEEKLPGMQQKPGVGRNRTAENSGTASEAALALKPGAGESTPS